MRSRKAVFFLSCLFFFVSQSVAALAAQGVIDSVTFKGEDNATESVTFHLTNGALPKSFVLKGERPRLVFDFMGSQLAGTVPSVITTDGVLVEKIRMGRHSDKTRVVLDLSSGSAVSFEQDFDSTTNLLTIQLLSTDYPAKDESTPHKAASAGEAAVVEEKVAAQATEEAEAVVEEEAVADVAKEETAAPVASEEPVETEVAITPVSPVVEKEAADSSEDVVDVVPVAEDDPLNPEAMLSEVSFENTSNKGEMVLFKLNGFYPPEVTGQEKGTPKVTCLFRGARMGEELVKVQTPNGQFVSKIVAEQKEQSAPVEVTLELVPHKNYDLQQVFFKEDNLFVIIVNSYDNMAAPAN